MNTTLPDAMELATGLMRRVGRMRTVDIAVVPPYPFIVPIAKRLSEERISVGAQDIHPGRFGAFTGAVSGAQLKSAGADFVLAGHSERRHVFGETDALVHAKLNAGLEHDLDVILCIGETLNERQAEQTFQVCERQMESGLAGLDGPIMARITIAYEPVWAIGTGHTASPAQAQEVHRHLREWLSDRFDSSTAATIRIQYGGSVKPSNVVGLMAGPDVDGALVGGASLDADSFGAIVSAAADVARGK